MIHPMDLEVLVNAQEDVSMPVYSSEEAAGADVRAHLKEAVVLAAGESTLIPTGLHFEIPTGFELQIRPRSGLALKHQITLLNTPATIDSDYRGEIKVILINHGKKPFVIEPNMRIAQFVFAPVCRASFIRAEALSESGRGSGGFGHTGLN